jgi:hypothetical protein
LVQSYLPLNNLVRGESKAIEGDQGASLHELFVVLAHLEQELCFGEGSFFFSDSGVVLTMTMNRIAKSPWVERSFGGLFFGFSHLLANP